MTHSILCTCSECWPDRMDPTNAKFEQAYVEAWSMTRMRPGQLIPSSAGPSKHEKYVTCVHRGPELRVQPCGTCAGKVELKVLKCAVHGECTVGKKVEGIACCTWDGHDCHDYKPTTPRRHLLYHLYPRKDGDTWRWNVDQLMQRINIFTGKRIVASVHDVNTVSPVEVAAAFDGRVELIHLPNDPSLRELQSFENLFGRVMDDLGSEVFYAHGKGVTRGHWSRQWAEAMYETCLDHVELVDMLLEAHPCAGSFKKIGHYFDESHSRWVYAGSFFWFKPSAFVDKDWRRVDRYWWGIEAWLGLHFQPQEAGTIFMEGVSEVNWWNEDFREKVIPVYEEWKTQRRLVEKAKTVGTESISFFGGSRIGGYWLQQSPEEIGRCVAELGKREYENYLEIGAAAGGTTRFLTDNLKIRNVWWVDLNDVRGEERPTNKAALRIEGSVHEWIGDSHSAECAEWLKASDVKFDLVFIDGDHSYEGVKQDLELVMPYLTDDATVFFHDTQTWRCPGVVKLVDELCASATEKLKLAWHIVNDREPRFGITGFEVTKCRME